MLGSKSHKKQRLKNILHNDGFNTFEYIKDSMLSKIIHHNLQRFGVSIMFKLFTAQKYAIFDT